MALIIGFYILFPFVIIWLCQRFPFFDKLGPVLICYLVGITVGNCGILPQGAAGLQDAISSATVAIALPLLLFSMDVRAWVKLAGKAILSMTGATIIIVAMAGFGSMLLVERVETPWKLAGLAIGVYTGGTPNMAAIKTALSVDSTTYLLMHTYDVFTNLIYLIFAMTFAQKVFNKFLPRFEFQENVLAMEVMETEEVNSFSGMLNKNIIKNLLLALLLSLIILGVAIGISELFPKDYATAMIILLITSMGIGASFVKKIRQIPKTFQLGMYIILIFCLVVGSMADLKDLININWVLMSYIVFCVFGTLILHAVFCFIFKIDTDTFIITSVAAICSPPFVPVVAGALKNKQIILSGLTTGIIGYAVGNYLGISFAYIFKALMS
ncbi:MAG: DUF819 family protein [Desulfobacteraceae bacterium]|nr:DUF819 family protein [Desulfobacteraceae bacterium]